VPVTVADAGSDGHLRAAGFKQCQLASERSRAAKLARCGPYRWDSRLSLSGEPSGLLGTPGGHAAPRAVRPARGAAARGAAARANAVTTVTRTRSGQRQVTSHCNGVQVVMPLDRAGTGGIGNRQLSAGLGLVVAGRRRRPPSRSLARRRSGLTGRPPRRRR
jgi:hypothetical protein